MSKTQPPELAPVQRSTDVGILALELWEQGLTAKDMVERGLIRIPLIDLTRILRQLTDTRSQAKAELSGAALDMARNVIENGQPKDHLKALQGLRVIDEATGSGLTIIIGANSAVQVNLGPVPSPLAIQETVSTQGLTHVIEPSIAKVREKPKKKARV